MDFDAVIKQMRDVRDRAEQENVALTEWAKTEIKDHLPLIYLKVYEAAANGQGHCSYGFRIVPNWFDKGRAENSYSDVERQALIDATPLVIESGRVQSHKGAVTISWGVDVSPTSPMPLPAFDPIAQSFFNYLQLRLLSVGLDPWLLRMRNGSVAQSMHYQKALMAELSKEAPAQSIQDYCNQVIDHFASIALID